MRTINKVLAILALSGMLGVILTSLVGLVAIVTNSDALTAAVVYMLTISIGVILISAMLLIVITIIDVFRD